MTRAGRIDFNATELDARAGIAKVMVRLQDLGLTPDQLGSIEIALAEAVNNIVEHAYANSAPGMVHIISHLTPNTLRLNLFDHGVPFPDAATPAPARADVSGPRETLPEGGFGWFLIRQLTDRLSYDRRRGCNRLCLEFRFDSERV